VSAPVSLAGLPPIDRQLGADPSLLGMELQHIIATAIAEHPRSKQQQIGPSEIGTPCTLRLGHKLAGTEPVNVSGLAVSTWLKSRNFSVPSVRGSLTSCAAIGIAIAP